jgi:hypothetical protein
MNLKKHHKFANQTRVVICILGVLILTACASSHHTFQMDNASTGVETILVVPFQNLYAEYGDTVRIDCSFCNRRHVIGDVPQEVLTFMTEHLKNLLMNDSSYRFVFPETWEEDVSDLPADENGVVRMTDLVGANREIDSADAILTGYFFKFTERVGTRYSVESPASVAFSLFLFRVSDGKIVWRGIFEETQQSLSENILKLSTFLKRKARWVSARELAADGLENLIIAFPKP